MGYEPQTYLRMSKAHTAAAALLLGSLAACTQEPPKHFTGIITNATMHTVTVKTPTADHGFTFSTVDADKSLAHGLLLGAPAVVEYRGELADGTPALRVETDSTYAAAVGRWTMPDPANPERVVGFELLVGGKARPIHSQTLVCTAWELVEGAPGPDPAAGAQHRARPDHRLHADGDDREGQHRRTDAHNRRRRALHQVARLTEKGLGNGRHTKERFPAS